MAETQVAKITPVEEFKQQLTRMTPEFTKILPPHVSAEKFTRVVCTAVINMPSLLDADRKSLYQACVDAATQGLMPDSHEGVIVPFKDKARFMPMIAGIAKKIRNSGEIGDMDAQVVCRNDAYEAWIDEKGRHFKWTKARGERGEPILTFAYALGRDGTFYFEEVDEADMAKIEASARAHDSPWKGPFKDEMKRKSALRRLAKYRLPQSTDLQNLTQTEDDLYQEPEKPSAPPEPGQPNRLKDIIGKATETTAEIPFGEGGVPI
jgi:recombination protein RecT